MAPEREIGLDALLERDQPELLEAGDVGLCERLVREIRERRAAPQAECLAKQLARAGRLASLQRIAPVACEALEALGV